MIDYTLKEYTVKNNTNKIVEKCCYKWMPNETKVVKLSKQDVFQINSCKYLSFVITKKPNNIVHKPIVKPIVKVEPVKVEEVKIEPLQEIRDIPETLVCQKCGKTYKSEKYYFLHIQKCKGGAENAR